MDVGQLAQSVKDSVHVSRVFGEPIERDGTTVIPVARVSGGAGGGGGGNPETGETGSGGGFGITAKPCGVYVIREGKVRFEPAIEINRVILIGQLLGLVALLIVRGALKRGSKRK